MSIFCSTETGSLLTSARSKSMYSLRAPPAPNESKMKLSVSMN